MMENVGPDPAFDSNCSLEDEDSPSPEADLIEEIEDIKLCWDVAYGRKKDLSRYEKVRLRRYLRRND